MKNNKQYRVYQVVERLNAGGAKYEPINGQKRIRRRTGAAYRYCARNIRPIMYRQTTSKGEIVYHSYDGPKV
jgi:hypothetical protein